MKYPCLLLAALLASGCAVTAVAGAAVDVGAAAVKTTAKVGGAAAGGVIDAVDADEEEGKEGRDAAPEDDE